jgi:tetratricopeptide (TPR) repeat protein
LELADEQSLAEALQVIALGSLSRTMAIMGDSERALGFARQSFELARQLPSNPGLLPLSLIALTIALRDQHRFAEAMEYAEQALNAARVAGVDEYVEPYVLYHIGRLAYLQDDLDRAVSSLSASLDQIRRLGPTETALYTFNTLATVRLKQGSVAEAAGLLREGRVLVEPSRYFGLWFDAIVLLAVKCQLLDHATRIHGYYSTYYASIGIGTAHVNPWLDVEISSMRDQVGGPYFDAEYKAGAALTKDDAMELAMQVLDRAEGEPPSGASAS